MLLLAHLHCWERLVLIGCMSLARPLDSASVSPIHTLNRVLTNPCAFIQISTSPYSLRFPAGKKVPPEKCDRTQFLHLFVKTIFLSVFFQKWKKILEEK